MGSLIRKINTNAIIRMLIVLLYGIFFAWLLQSGLATKYVHPRTIPFIKFAVIVLFIGTILMSTQIFNPNNGKISPIKTLVLCLPLFLGFYFPPLDMKSPVDNEADVSSGIYYGVDNKDSELPGMVGKSFNKMLDESPLINEKEIKIEDRNFLSWMDELFRNPQRHTGKPFEITANFFNNESNGKKSYFVGRYVMTCCLADLEQRSIIIKTDKNFENNDWVHIKGTMSTEKVNGQIMPVVLVNNIEKMQNKEMEYIYGY